MKKYLIPAGILLSLLIAFGIGMISRPAPVVQKANAEWAPAALQLVDQIKTAGQNWNAGQAELTAATKAMTDAQTKIGRAEAAGKGADLTLCATFQARYDRASDKIVADATCPLL